MANVRLQPPDSFDFKKPDEWQRWKRRFEQFRLASALSSESDERQISTLLYCLAEEVVVSTGITTDERKKYNDVVSKFEQFLKSGRIQYLSGRDSTAEISKRVNLQNSI